MNWFKKMYFRFSQQSIEEAFDGTNGISVSQGFIEGGRSYFALAVTIDDSIGHLSDREEEEIVSFIERYLEGIKMNSSFKSNLLKG